ncbi:MAG: UDP-N-acetylmuramoyl-L-alanyl-D-glutamate--2,6-diaminopimelate ligase [Pseudomonadota bacterium]
MKDRVVNVSLKDIVADLDTPLVKGDLSVEVTGVTHDSRKVVPGWAFVAKPGAKSDGHEFISAALKNGAAAIFAQRAEGAEAAGVPWVTLPDTRPALGRIAAAVYDRPTERLTLVGITGTNGKTTLTFLLEAIIKASGGSPGVVGTIDHRWKERAVPAANTTPEASDLQRLFHDMVQDGVTHAVMEVSSHGLDLFRSEGCLFDVGVFTNLTRDHLDHHGTMEEYYRAKRKLFTDLLAHSCKSKRSAVINLDDPYGLRLAAEITDLTVIGYGTSDKWSVYPEDASIGHKGIRADIRTPSGSVSINSSLTGSFNLMNILAAVAVAERLGIEADQIRAGIEAVRIVPGRLERIDTPKGTIFVDYAHTPDALKNVLDALGRLGTGRIITVMGCGGDRDRTKRPMMGTEAAAGSDVVIITSDNPRSEEPDDIIAQVVPGVEAQGFTELSHHVHGSPLRPCCYRVMPDRRDAIFWAVENMSAGDVLLVAGKGHETYQEIKGIRYPFDDRETVREALSLTYSA